MVVRHLNRGFSNFTTQVTFHNMVKASIKISLTLLALLFSIEAFTQYFNKQNAWKFYRREFSASFGFSNYLGDLGGLDKPGTKFFLMDLEMSTFKRCYGGSFRYHLRQDMSVRLTGFYGNIEGSDALTAHPERSYRNLDFQSKIYEGALIYEFYFLRNSPGHLYNIKNAKGKKPQRFDLFLFAGVGGFWFNPTSGGVPLRPLRTEGQGLPGGPKPYSRFQVCFPGGFGVNMLITNTLKIGLEGNYRVTMTDYLDDVSTFYYDNQALRQAYGDASANMADKSSGANPNWTVEGAIRGNPKNDDSYMSALLTLTYIWKRSVTKPQRQGGEHPFKRHKKRSNF